MRFLRNVISSLLVLVVVLVVIAYLLPQTVTVERSIVIDAPPEAIFPHVNSLKANEAWSPWLDRDPDIQLAYEGPDEGVGSKLTWASDHPQVGSGTNTITASVPNRRVETALDFGSMGTADAWVDLAPSGGGTEVKWGFTTDLGLNPVARWTGLMMDSWVGADYEDGLGRLKALVEAG